jgi:hypothetical protein
MTIQRSCSAGLQKNPSPTSFVCYTLLAFAKNFSPFFILGLDTYLQVATSSDDYEYIACVSAFDSGEDQKHNPKFRRAQIWA